MTDHPATSGADPAADSPAGGSGCGSGAVPDPGPPAVDARGRRCPVPVIELARHLTDAGVGELIEVWADDPAAAADVPAWCRMRHQEYVGSHALPDGGSAYTVRRTH